MKINMKTFLQVSVVGAFLLGSAHGQDGRAIAAAGNEFVISAKAGGVSFIEGDVAVVKPNGRSGRLLRTDSLEVGDKVVTGETGKVEIMLNPGSFARVGGDSTFEFGNTSLDNLLLKLNSGSMILEVYAGDDFKVFVRTPNALMDITRSGVFRIDALADGGGRLSVIKGSTVFGVSRVTVKTGYAVTVQGTKGTMAKFDRDSADQLTAWSKLRGKEAARANAKLQRRALNGSLLSTFDRGMWNMYGSFGLWVFNPARGSWFFLPFGSGWRSPYGHWYDYDIWAFNFPNYVFLPNTVGGQGTGGNGGSTGGGSIPAEKIVPSGGGRRTDTKAESFSMDGASIAPTPVFRKFENTQRTYGEGPVNNGHNDGRFGGGYRDTGLWSPSSGSGGSGGFGGGADSKAGSGMGSPASQSGSSGSSPATIRLETKDN